MNEEQLLDEKNIDNIDLGSVDIDDVFKEEPAIEGDESIVNLEDLASDDTSDTDDMDLSQGLEDMISGESDNLDDILSNEEEQEEVSEISEEPEEAVADIDVETAQDLETEESIEEPGALDELLEEESTDIVEEENLDILEEPQNQITEPIVEEEESEDTKEEIAQEVPVNSEVITNDLKDIKIEFGIEAKGFILSTNMMEVMISKGYIFKDMIDNKEFDAVMIFNGNLENTVTTNDIKIKIEDGKIQLIKG